MPNKKRKGRPYKKGNVNQVHLERVARNQWYMIVSDAVFFFKPKFVEKILINRSALEKLYVEIKRELEIE